MEAELDGWKVQSLKDVEGWAQYQVVVEKCEYLRNYDVNAQLPSRARARVSPHGSVGHFYIFSCAVALYDLAKK